MAVRMVMGVDDEPAAGHAADRMVKTGSAGGSGRRPIFQALSRGAQAFNALYCQVERPATQFLVIAVEKGNGILRTQPGDRQLCDLALPGRLFLRKAGAV